ncbi:RdgB/HAM1 family non-canonical purine NTP pyrophosphatase [Candidatus Woesearchaeota archaeon]|nr:RdgB/HAM1 family non-canonical purine NTP pyrophosphatase [Candidatus Woesearchaeota archaeon]
MIINFVTQNKGKVREFKQILEPKVRVKQLSIDYPELRSDAPEEIARLAAKQLADKLKRIIVVEDSGLFIKALNDFPGTCSAYIHKRIGLKGLLKLMKGVRNRNCEYRSAVGYCEPSKKPVSFLGKEKGKIAKKIKGTHGFGHDPIFIPEGSKKTYGEMDDIEEVKKFRRRAVLKLVNYLKNQI